jgi:Tfp pilus assembly protein PilF
LQGKAKIDSAVEIDAIDLARAFNMRGIAMVQNGKFKIAEKLYCNAVQLIKDSGVVHKLWLNLGLCMKKKGDLVKALEYFERCDKSSPEGYARAKSQILQVRELLLSNKRPGLRSDNTSTIDALDYGSFKG